MSTMLRGFWYLAASGRRLKPGRTLPVQLLGRSVLLARRADGAVSAFDNACPHRGMPLHHGGFRDGELQCGFHGWRFRAADGVCTAIPSLTAGDATDPARFRLRQHPCREVQGNIWVFHGDGEPPELPAVPGFDGRAPQIHETMRFPCGVDLAVTGFIDPGHPAFVHTSRWWKRDPASSLREKEKHFEPDRHGFRMRRHHLKHGANPYRLLGRDVHIDITIQLPGLRVERIEGSRHAACVLAAATPVSEPATAVHYCVDWPVPWRALLRPVAAWMARDFLGQDRDVAVRMAENPAPAPQMFVGDPDAQVRWWLRLRREHAEAEAEGRPFRNPLRERMLQWRS